MKRIIWISILLHSILSLIVLFAQDIPKAELRHVKTFPVGKGNGEIGWETGTDPEPKSLCFDKKGFLYITDGANTRLDVFDSSFAWTKNIKTRNGYLLVSKIWIDDNGEFEALAKRLQL